jgi:hypothetical protein
MSIEEKELCNTSSLIDNHDLGAIDQGKEVERKEENERIQPILDNELYLTGRQLRLSI